MSADQRPLRVTWVRAAVVAGMTLAGVAAGMGLNGWVAGASVAGGAALGLWTVAAWCVAGWRWRVRMRAAGVTVAGMVVPLFWSLAAVAGWVAGDWVTGGCLSGVAVLLWVWGWRVARRAWRRARAAELEAAARWTALEKLITGGYAPVELIWYLRRTQQEEEKR